MGMFTMDKADTVENCVDDLRMFNALPPYDGRLNYNAFDGYFGFAINSTYSDDVLKQARAIVEPEIQESRK